MTSFFVLSFEETVAILEDSFPSDHAAQLLLFFVFMSLMLQITVFCLLVCLQRI